MSLLYKTISKSYSQENLNVKKIFIWKLLLLQKVEFGNWRFFTIKQDIYITYVKNYKQKEEKNMTNLNT